MCIDGLLTLGLRMILKSQDEKVYYSENMFMEEMVQLLHEQTLHKGCQHFMFDPAPSLKFLV